MSFISTSDEVNLKIENEALKTCLLFVTVMKNSLTFNLAWKYLQKSRA